MIKKKKKFEQKEDLQEPQFGNLESEVVEGMVHCKNCKEEVEPSPAGNNRWRCPLCQKYIQSPVMKKDVENVKEKFILI